MHQLGNALLQGLLVDLVGQLVHDDGLALTTINIFKMHLGAHDHAATASAVAFAHTADTVNNTARGEVGGGDDFNQIIHAGFGVMQQVQASIHHFIQVVRWNIGGHTHSNTCRAVYQ